ncbi:MAG: DUF348 domain-containing protein [Firmicutes bacterium]|nr:DUF348 domain-containing protein [Bacillota bacterium]
MIEKIKEIIFRLEQKRPLLKKDLKRILKPVAAAGCVILCGLLIAGYCIPKQVTVFIDDSLAVTSSMYDTTSSTVEQFLQSQSIDFVQNEDKIDVALDSAIEDGMTIHITKEICVDVVADGKNHRVEMLPATASIALEEAGVDLGEEDMVTPALGTPLKEGDKVVVSRVRKERVYETETEDYQVVYEADPNITIGDMKVTQKGRKGKLRKVYEITYVDGKKTDRKLVESKVVTKKRDKVIGYGTKISFGKPKNLTYKRKLENVRAVSYYFSGSPVGCYGLPCEFGTVAVDKDLIPLGSLLYIEGYGYAIANDVGSAIKGKVVDLYMEKYEQCILWGARNTTVYVIEEGKG